MILSPAGRQLIKSFEGLSLKAYPDAAGYSIGYGHYGASRGQVITREEADRLFDSDVSRFERRVSESTPVATQNQFDAMVSLAYNIRETAFDTSTLKKVHNAMDHGKAANEFLRWNKSGGEVHPGLVARRAKEREIYLSNFSGLPVAIPTVIGPPVIPHPETRGSTLEPLPPAPSKVNPAVVALVGAAVWALWRLLRNG